MQIPNDLRTRLRRLTWIGAAVAALAALAAAVALRPLQLEAATVRHTCGTLVFIALVCWLSAGQVALWVQGDVRSARRAAVEQRTWKAALALVALKGAAVVLLGVVAGLADNFGLLVLTAFPVGGILQLASARAEQAQQEA